jgi:homocysteine S-methyltransferase
MADASTGNPSTGYQQQQQQQQQLVFSNPQHPVLLRDWFLGHRSPTCCTHHHEKDTTTATMVLDPANAALQVPRILILDGGVSTHLEEKLNGVPFPVREFWSSGLLIPNQQHHNLILQGHTDWLQAGADVISTVTYQCHYEEKYWPSKQQHRQQQQSQIPDTMTSEIMDQMWKDGIELAKTAIRNHHHHDNFNLQQQQPNICSRITQKPHFVLASLGCYGAAMANGAEYTGDYYEGNDTNDIVQCLQRFHRKKLQAALRHGPDGIAFETIPNILECQAVRNVLLGHDNEGMDANHVVKEKFQAAACYVSLACRNGKQLNDGTPVHMALDILAHVPSERLHAIGMNCCDAQILPELITVLMQHPIMTGSSSSSSSSSYSRGIVLYPNSGEQWDASTSTWITKEENSKQQDVVWANQMLDSILHFESTWRQQQQKQKQQTKSTASGTAKLVQEMNYPSILIGGCCRTRPSTIAALRRVVDQHLQGEREGGQCL